MSMPAPATAGPSTTSRHGKKTSSTPLGCRTTKPVTNGNGNRRCANSLATLPLFEIAIVLLRLDYVGLEARIGAIRAQTSHAPRLSAHRPGQTAYRLVIVTALWRYFRLKHNLNLLIVARGVNAVPERLYIRIDGYQRRRPSAG